MTEPTGDFRCFALDVYGGDGVSSAAVLLQDRCGVDVNVLLLAAFVGASRGLSFGTREAAGAVARTVRWQREVVIPLRALRTRLKEGPPPAPNPVTSALRERIKAAELEAEMIELAELSDFAEGLDAPVGHGAASTRAAAAMQAVVRESAHRAPNPNELDAIAAIASAAARFGKEVTA